MAQKMIKISVKSLDETKQCYFKELYRNSVEIPSDVSFDYNLVERALSILYPGCSVSFQIFAL